MLSRMYRKLRILATHGGRECGWFLEHQGRCIGVLCDGRQEDMFWHSYRVEPLTDDPADLALLRDDGFWEYRFQELRFLNRGFPDVLVNPHAFPSSKVDAASGRISFRSLYLRIRVYPWDWLAYWLFQPLLRRAKGEVSF